MDEKDLIIKNLQERNGFLSKQLISSLSSCQIIDDSLEIDDVYKNRLADFIWRISGKSDDKDLYQCLVEEFLIQLNADRVTLMIQGNGPKQSLVVVKQSFAIPVTNIPLPYFVELDSSDPYKKFLDQAIVQRRVLIESWDEVIDVHPEISIKSSSARAIELELDGVWVISLQWFDSIPKWNQQDEILFEEMTSYTKIVLEQAHLSSSIKELKNQNESLIESMPSALIGLDLLANITFWSGKAQDFFGISEEDAIGFEFEKLVPQFKGISKDLANLLQADEEMIIEPVLYETIKGKKYLQPHLYSMFSKNRGEVALRIDDITRQIEVQDHILHAQKIETIATIVGDIANDFNNLLGGVIGSASLLLAKCDETKSKNEASEKDLQQVLCCAKKAKGLANRLIVLAKHNVVEFKKIDLVKCINTVQNLCQKTFGDEINIKTNIELKEALVIGAESQLENMLLNICLNGRNAIQEKIRIKNISCGDLSLELSNFEVDDDFCIRHSCGEFKNFFRIDIQDTGIGVNNADKLELFDPFISTKGMNGDRIALAFIEKCLENHSGYIDVASAKGVGSIYSIFIPNISEMDLEISSFHDMKSNGIKVLISEKDKVIRETCTDALMELSYNVFNVKSRLEAVFLLNQDKDFDVLIIDADSKEQEPLTFFKELEALFPKMRIVFLTKEISDFCFKEAAFEKNVVVLEKPFSLDQLEASLL